MYFVDLVPVPCVCRFGQESWRKGTDWGFFCPESSALDTEEIIVFVKRLNLVPKCTQLPSLSPVPLPVLPGLLVANTWNMKSLLLRVQFQLGLGL